MTGIAPTVGWIVAAASAVAVTAFVIVDHRHPRGLAHVLGSAAAVVTFSAFPALGAAVLTRHPAHRLGWLFTGVGAAITIGSTCAAIVDVARPGSTAWTVAAILADVGWIAAVGPPTALLGLLLPDGELLSRRWRPVAAISGTIVTVLAIATALRPDLGYAGRANPIGLAIAGPLVNDGGLVAPVLLASGIASCWLRFRRSRGVERLQLTWIVATFLTVIERPRSFNPTFLSSSPNVGGTGSKASTLFTCGSSAQ